ncbi:hypothetical protein ACHQM5_004722 [Ranunculus cassubicifolius]
MGREKEKEKVVLRVFWKCLIELKIFLTALFFICLALILLQYHPIHLDFSPSNLGLCFSTASNEVAQPLMGIDSSSVIEKDEILSDGGGMIKRVFNAYGSAAYSFIKMATYRGGVSSFAVIGLSSKPLQLYAKPIYQCEWIPSLGSNQSKITINGYKILPDWGYGRVYTVVVINCTFPVDVGVDGFGGELNLYASTGGGGDRDVDSMEKIEALSEAPKELNSSVFSSPPVYDYLYCGSPLYGNLSPQRVREWIAYHVRLFGEKSHFVIYDAGGVHPGVLEVLKPWIEKGFVTLQDIRMQERFDGYYHNQFLVVNDCLHRYRFMAKWMFFFDVDEYIYVTPKNTIKSVMDSLSGYTQFTFEQMPMSNKLCLASDAGRTVREWGFEKLVYRDVKRGIRRDRKYAIQPRNVVATGVHMSQNVIGRTQHKLDGRIKYFHYHGTISERREPCRQLVNETEIIINKNPYVLDTSLRDVAAAVKRFELRTIGSSLQRTRQ